MAQRTLTPGWPVLGLALSCACGSGGSAVDAATAVSRDSGARDAGPGDACVMSQVELGTLVALGSSSAAGAGASDEAHRFVNLIAARVGAQTLTNLSRGGQRGADVIGAIADQARASDPDLVVVLSFTDYASSAGESMAEAWSQVLAPLSADGARIFFGDVRISPLWVCDALPTPTGRCYSRAQYDLIRAKNRAVAAALGSIPGVSLVPIYDDNAAHPEWVALDGHPNDLGHANLAQAFLAYIEPSLEQRRCDFEG